MAPSEKAFDSTTHYTTFSKHEWNQKCAKPMPNYLEEERQNLFVRINFVFGFVIFGKKKKNFLLNVESWWQCFIGGVGIFRFGNQKQELDRVRMFAFLYRKRVEKSSNSIFTYFNHLETKISILPSKIGFFVLWLLDIEIPTLSTMQKQTALFYLTYF